MKNAAVIGIAMIALAGTTMAIAAEYGDSRDSRPMEFVKDSAITTKVKSKLAAEHLSSMGRIHVDTDKDGVVWLSGKVRSQEAIEKAIHIARETEGVTRVHSDLTVKHHD
jgi:hyperosmotically inducible protein